MTRSQRRVLEGAAVAAVLAGMPSTLDAVRRERTAGAVASYLWEATAAIGTLTAPGRPSVVRGSVIHVALSLACAEGLGAGLPVERSVRWGAVAGFGIGLVNVGLLGRRFPAISALPRLPQYADNAAFGAIFALVADR